MLFDKVKEDEGGKSIESLRQIILTLIVLNTILLALDYYEGIPVQAR